MSAEAQLPSQAIAGARGAAPIRGSRGRVTMPADAQTPGPIGDTRPEGTMSVEEQTPNRDPIRQAHPEGAMSVDQAFERLTVGSGLDARVSDPAPGNIYSEDDRRDLHLWEAIAEIIKIAEGEAGFHEIGWVPKRADIEYLDIVVKDIADFIKSYCHTERSVSCLSADQENLEQWIEL